MKTFVLDTNVLLHNADALKSFSDNKVVLPIEVLEELDKFKKHRDERGRNAREVIRQLDALRHKGNLGKGVKLENEGIIQIITAAEYNRGSFPQLSLSQVDNRLLLAGYMLQKKGENVIFVSKDINARVKADSVGLYSMDFEKQKVDFDKLYQGWRTLEVSKETVESVLKNSAVKIEDYQFYPNEFVVLKEQKEKGKTVITRYCHSNGMLKILAVNSDTALWAVKPRNMEQIMALDLLLDENIWLVTMVGSAGTGKTLLALAAGLKKVISEGYYSKILVSRPIMPLGKDIGFLPGTKEEKLENWMEPIFDNLEFILNVHKKREKAKFKTIEDFFESGLIQVEALTYMRGRSIPEQFIIIDEAQNLTPHEIKTVVSRAGSNTKVVLTGDPYQIDSPYLNSSDNGLSYCVDKMKGQKIFGHMTLTKSERSELASIAAEIL